MDIINLIYRAWWVLNNQNWSNTYHLDSANLTTDHYLKTYGRSDYKNIFDEEDVQSALDFSVRKTRVRLKGFIFHLMHHCRWKSEFLILHRRTSRNSHFICHGQGFHNLAMNESKATVDRNAEGSPLKYNVDNEFKHHDAKLTDQVFFCALERSKLSWTHFRVSRKLWKSETKFTSTL